MPCDSSYMEATNLEVKISQVACLLDEIAGKEYRPQDWDGYHPRVYCRCSRKLADALVAELCAALRERDVTQYSLEMQTWWRDHQAADQMRKQPQPAKPPAFLLTPFNGWTGCVDGNLAAVYSDRDGAPGHLLWSADGGMRQGGQADG